MNEHRETFQNIGIGKNYYLLSISDKIAFKLKPIKTDRNTLCLLKEKNPTGYIINLNIYTHFKNQIGIYWAFLTFCIWPYMVITFSLIVLARFSKAICFVWQHFTDFSTYFVLFFLSSSASLTSFPFLSLSRLLFRFSPYITFTLCFPSLWNIKLFTISRESGPGSVEINPRWS